jgi:hypothetical protein
MTAGCIRSYSTLLLVIVEYIVCIKIKLCLEQTVEAYRFVRRRESPTFLDSRLTDDGEVVSCTRWPRFTLQEDFLVLISVRGWVNPRVMARLEALRKSKKKINNFIGILKDNIN